MAIKNLQGQRFGRLTVVEFKGQDNQGNALWRCECDCGGEIVTRNRVLSQGDATSCGCKRIESTRKHGMLKSPNSATVEESGFISSQPTLFFTTDIEQAEFEAWNPGGIQIGSTRGYSLGRAGQASMLQANESQLALKLMQEKENQMLMIGARIVQQSGQNETAEAARIRYSSDNSVLGTIAGNVSEALKRAILDAQLYMSGKADMTNTVFWLNQEFFDASLTSQDVLALIQSWQQGIIAKSDVRTKFRQTGWLEADRNDDDIDAERAEEPAIEGDAVSDNADPLPEE